MLDPLCELAPQMLSGSGTILIMHSEFADIGRTVEDLQSVGLHAEVVAEQWIPLGPVMVAPARWLERAGLLDAGRRMERLVVVSATRP